MRYCFENIIKSHDHHNIIKSIIHDAFENLKINIQKSSKHSITVKLKPTCIINNIKMHLVANIKLSIVF